MSDEEPEKALVHKLEQGDRVAYRRTTHARDALERIWRSKHGEEVTTSRVKVTRDDIEPLYDDPDASFESLKGAE